MFEKVLILFLNGCPDKFYLKFKEALKKSRYKRMR